MNAFELKGGLYDMIARVQDKELLTKIHESILRLINQNLEKTDFGKISTKNSKKNWS